MALASGARVAGVCLIEASHNHVLVFASIAVSLVAAFTGLALTNNLSRLPEPKRKALIVMSAFILGGGIWSMHFVAMLAHQFPVPVYYDALQTPGSALVAILVVGVALLMLHFTARTRQRLNMAGLILGAGVIVMHYIGMLAIRGRLPQFSTWSIALAVLVAAVAGVIAIRVAYGHRSKQNIVRGSIVFGLAVVAVHYAAMLGTSFAADDSFQPVPLAMDNDTLALGVTLASFLICGSFLLAATTFLTRDAASSEIAKPLPVADVTSAIPPSSQPSVVPNQSPQPVPDSGLPDQTDTVIDTGPQIDEHAQNTANSLEIPYEQNKKVGFANSGSVAAIRADGHYTHLYTRAGVRFCPWSITEAEKRLAAVNFHRTHRSYLVNIAEVASFEKRKDSGVCLFQDYPRLSSVPVSRNRVIGLTDVLKQHASERRS